MTSQQVNIAAQSCAEAAPPARGAQRRAGMRATGALLAALTLAVTAAAADTQVVAGKRVGAVEIGMRRAQVDKLLGAAAAEHVQSPHRTNGVWAIGGDGDRRGELHVQFVDGVATRIGTGAKSYATADGIAAGAAVASVRALHPHTAQSDYFVRRSGGVAVQCHDDVGAGIGFEFDKGAGQPAFVLRSIYVHAPGKATPCGREDDPRATRKVGAAANKAQ